MIMRSFTDSAAARILSGDGDPAHFDLLKERVLACTQALVDCALQANWEGVLDGLEVRRELLQEMLLSKSCHQEAQYSAISAAVEESERALMRVIAHAVAGSRFTGAAFMMYH